MFFAEWQERAKKAVGIRGHGSRKAIGAALGVTSETIRKAEKDGIATAKMVRSLEEYLAQSKGNGFQALRGEAGRWAVARASDGGIVVTHLQRPLAISVHLGIDGQQRVVAYDTMHDTQLASLVAEAEAVAAQRAAGLGQVEGWSSEKSDDNEEEGAVAVIDGAQDLGDLSGVEIG